MGMVKHNKSEHFFYLIEDGKECRAEYTFKEGSANIIDLYHTYVPEELSGRGIARTLMEEVVGFLKENHLMIFPSCSYAAKFFSKPEYEHFVAKI